MTRRIALVSLVFLFVAYFGYNMVLAVYGMDPLDEGILTYSASRVLDGAVLYRDVFVNWNPGRVWFLSVWFGLIDQSLFTGKIVGALSATLVALVVFYAISKMGGSKVLAVLISFMYLVLVGPRSQTALMNFVFSGMAICLMIAPLSSQRIGRIAVGFLVGMCSLFQTFDAAAALAGTLIAMISVTITTRTWSRFIHDIVLIIGGLGLVILPVLAYFAINGALGEASYALVWYNLATSGQLARDVESFPSLAGLLNSLNVSTVFRAFVWYLPVVVLPLGVVLAFADFRRKDPRFGATVGIVTYALISYPSFLRRPDFGHLVHYAYFGIVLMMGLLAARALVPGRMDSHFHSGTRGHLRVPVRYVSKLLIIVLLISLPSVYAVSSQIEYVRGNTWSYLDLPRGQTYGPSYLVSELKEASVFLKENTLPDEKILALPWNPLINFVADRESPSKYTWFLPWSSTVQMQMETIEALESGKIRYVFYFTDYGGMGWGQNNTIRQYAPLLMQYVFGHYVQLRVIRPNLLVLGRVLEDRGGTNPILASGSSEGTRGLIGSLGGQDHLRFPEYAWKHDQVLPREAAPPKALEFNQDTLCAAGYSLNLSSER